MNLQRKNKLYSNFVDHRMHPKKAVFKAGTRNSIILSHDQKLFLSSILSPIRQVHDAIQYPMLNGVDNL